MSLLTDKERLSVLDNYELPKEAYRLCLDIESAVLEKLKAQGDVGVVVDNGTRGTTTIRRNDDVGMIAYGTRLYEHPLPPADVVRIAELEAVLRECRESLDAVTKWNAPPDFNGRKIDRIVEKAIAKIVMRL